VFTARYELNRQIKFRLVFRNRGALQCLRRLIAGLSTQRAWFDPRSVHVRFVIDEVAVGQGLLSTLRFLPVSIIPPTLHTPLSVSFHQRSTLPCQYHSTNAPHSSVSIIPPTLHTLHLYVALTRTTNRQNQGTFRK
jgi:hypothetical protein